jgi:hypothetical protein
VCGLCVKGLLEGDYCTHIKSYRKWNISLIWQIS